MNMSSPRKRGCSITLILKGQARLSTGNQYHLLPATSHPVSRQDRDRCSNGIWLAIYIKIKGN